MWLFALFAVRNIDLKKIPKHIIHHFNKNLIQWHADHPREMPWKHTSNPYFIWLSEIILQQTRVAQGWSYYLKFVEKYPTVHDLAQATEGEVLSAWQGLGYNSRARNLHAASQYIVDELEGKFPSTYDGILALKGVGPYSAAAISSFAFGLPHAVVDGNVKRVFARFFDLDQSIDERTTHQMIDAMANQILGGTDPALFNQAIMNFGALQCVVKKPLCATCPLQEKCSAFLNDTVHLRPVRSPKRKRTNRFFHYFVFVLNGEVLLQIRPEKDIWQNMYTFPAIETNHAQRLSGDQRELNVKKFIHLARIKRKHPPIVATQLLTHRKVKGTFYRYDLDTNGFKRKHLSNLVSMKNLSNFAVPKIIADYLSEHVPINR